MNVFSEYDLTLKNSYRIKAVCRRAFFPENEQDFIFIYKTYPETKKVILGGGYNVILSKEYYEEDFIITESFSRMEVISIDQVKIDAGANTINLSEFALKNSLSGLEIFYDIPSSVGGAIVMNAGASGEDIKDILIKVKYLDLKDLTVKEIRKEDGEFEYRNSYFQKNADMIVLRAWLQLRKGKPADIWEKMERAKQARWAKQPKDYPNAGSVFKRPNGYYVGALIDALNLKGLAVGGAKVSEKHGGFIVNYRNAKGSDIVQLIEMIRKMVSEKLGVELEVEQRII